MSHKYGTLAAWNRSIDDRGPPEPEPPAGGGTATRAQLQAMRDLAIPFDLERPPTFDDAARLIREAEEAENPMRVVMGPPVRDIREAMHPAGIISHEPPFARPAEPGDAPIAGALIEGAFPWIDPETIGFDPEIAKTIERAAHPLQTLLGGPHVATLPDGTRVNLPAGTVLREGHDDMVDDAADQFFDDVCKLIPWEKPDVPERREALRIVGDMAEQTRAVRGLLQRARIRLVDEPDAKKLDAEIAAFLAGASPPEHPVIALVRSFVGKPGDRGPVWGALMRLRERLDESGDLAAIDLGDELVNALNERLGQMHDALGRDTTEERTL